MSDVSTWSPTDDANTAAPPAGWPEFMMPSMVNNSARAMQGAIRRMYDQLLAGSLVLPYLKLSGGTVAGAVAVTGSLSGGSITSGTSVYANTTISAGGAISASGSITSAVNVTASGNIQAGGGVGGALVSSSGNVNAATNYQINGLTFANRDPTTTYLYDPSPVWTVAAASDGNNYYANTTHWFKNRGNTATYAAIGAAGMTINGAINAGTAAISGDATVSGQLVAPRLSGGAGDAGTLKSWGTGNSINFRWANISGTDYLTYRIDEVVERAIATVPATMAANASLEDLIEIVQQLVARVTALEGGA